ncbi:WYL domain-containing protein [Paramuribaculum intestinale]|uniref:RNA-binding domain-containing protein n=3 Tax=Paramuribaculum intestinale TaxID=2094151 RepID=UPI0025A94207|nr:WYL domain-containing protein [Paramuribaculum intestinale]
MEKSNQPPFWLQVKEDYIFDNFDGLVKYLENYNYSHTGDPLRDNPDYEASLDCMKGMLDRMNECLDNHQFSHAFPDDIDIVAYLKLYAATVLADLKAGNQPHSYLMGMLDLLVLTQKNTKDEVLKRLWDIAVGCVRRRRITRIRVNWTDIRNLDASRLPTFIIRLADGLEFAPDADGQTYFYEHNGTLAIGHDEVSVAACNLEAFERMSRGSFACLDGLLTIVADRADVKAEPSFDEFQKRSNVMLQGLKNFKPSVRRQLKEYADGEEVYVKVTSIEGDRIKVATADPSYVTIHGELFRYFSQPGEIMTIPAYSALADLTRSAGPDDDEGLVVGDVMRVMYKKNVSNKFDVRPALENFYRELARRSCAQAFDGIYTGTFGSDSGTLWRLVNGLTVAVHRSKYDEVPSEYIESVRQAADEGTSISLQTYKEVSDQQPMRIYAQFDTFYPYRFGENNFKPEDADRNFLYEFLNDCNANCPFDDEPVVSREMIEDPRGVRLLSNFICYILHNGDFGSVERLEYITAAHMLSLMSDRPDDVAYMELQRQYLVRLVAFSRNRDVTPLALSDDDRLASNADVVVWQRIISELNRYRHPESRTLTTEVRDNQDASINKLIDASNSLIGIINETELNNIKKSIAQKLGVDDEYVAINADRTFYGEESSTLELKKSIVFPPVNRRRFKEVEAEPDVQKWAILKTVCGFLNSELGGDLLLGVNDNGYAEGLDADISELMREGLIKVVSNDAYSRYVQSVVEDAFVDADNSNPIGDVLGSDITYATETSKEGKYVLRVRVKPYTFGLVKFKDGSRPEGLHDSYVRQSGKTVPMTPSLASRLRAQRTARDTSDMALLRKAADEKRVAVLKGYASSSGRCDRQIEVYKIWEQRRTICGYDILNKKTRLFKVTRCEGVELAAQKWSRAHGTTNLDIDPFGMSFEQYRAQEMVIRLSAYGYRLLVEEFPVAGKLVQQLQAADASGAMFELRCPISSPEGLGRFIMSVPGHAWIVQGDSLKEYVEEKTKILTQCIG